MKVKFPLYLWYLSHSRPDIFSMPEFNATGANHHHLIEVCKVDAQAFLDEF